MKMIFKAFAKKLFGSKYERFLQTLFLYFILFLGLSIADLQVQITPFILYLMVSTFTAGIMWQALSSKDNTTYMQNIIMLPFDCQEFVFSYIAILGIYTFFTKSVGLLAVLLALSTWSLIEILGSVLCIINAILMTAVIYSNKKYWYKYTLWISIVIVALLFLSHKLWFLPLLLANSIIAIIFLQNTDGYTFYLQESENNSIIKSHSSPSIWRYFFRYLKYHKNYLINTTILWCMAYILPLFFKQIDPFTILIGFAILSFNTPICILLSCDLAFEQAIRFLPNQKKTFCIPYCLFLFLSNTIADIIFLCSLQIQNGNVTILLIITALFFALQSAISSVLLEWFYPIRNWKIESDLWHHPRKYIVPVTMLFLAGAICILSIQIPILLILFGIEIAIILFWH